MNRRHNIWAACAAFAILGTSAFAQTPGDAPFGAPAPVGGQDPAVTPADDMAPRASTPQVAATDLYEFRFVQGIRWDGAPIVKREMLTREQTIIFDANKKKQYLDLINAGQLPYYPQDGSGEPNAWADWGYYSEQVGLWGAYVAAMFFDEVPAECTIQSLRFPGDPTGTEAGQERQFLSQEGTANRLVEQNQGRSMDDQLGSFFSAPPDGNQQGGPTAFPATMMDDQVRLIYQCFLRQVRIIEQEQDEYMIAFDQRLSERQIARIAYDEWRQDREVALRDHVNDWFRRYEGSISVIDGVRYELYRPGQAPGAVTRGARVVESNANITPYDIMNDDGTLKGPALSD